MHGFAICKYCGGKFRPKPWPATRAKYCSASCNKAAWYQRNKVRVNAKAKIWCGANRPLRLEVQRRWNASPRAKLLKQKWRDKHALTRVLTPDERKLIAARTTSRRRLKRHRPIKRCVCRGRHHGRIECHHRDGNPLNTTLSNLEWRCYRHHRKLHGQFRDPLPASAIRALSRRPERMLRRRAP